jgi:hypothetical protein
MGGNRLNIGHYNEYYLPNNSFLYKHDYSITRLRSKKSFAKFMQDLVKKYGQETINKQTILYNGVTTCVLAYIHDPHGNPSSISYFLRHLDQNGLALHEHEPLTIVELENLFKANRYLIHIYKHGLVATESDWIEFEAHYMNNLLKFASTVPIDLTRKYMNFEKGV